MTKKFIAAALLLMSAMNISAQEMTYSPAATLFSLWAPTADSFRVNIYADALGGQLQGTYLLNKEYGGKNWSRKLNGDLKGKYYTFQISQQGKWLAENPGPGVRAVGVNGLRGAIIDMRDTNPAGWESDRSPVFGGQKEAILYEMHHRDFSVDPSSGIRNKGKFLALTEYGTKNPGGLATGIDHLKELGVTHVHLLPSYDFGSIDELTGNAYGGGGRVPSKYNWGYDPVNYNAPEGSYSTNAKDPATRIKEFKQMVMALHKAGIRVVMDVVYNHVFDLDKSSFNRTVPGYYFRYKDKNGKPQSSNLTPQTSNLTPANGSGCGNETASDHEGYHDFMVNSIKYWMQEYHVDGFRFDLMAIHDIKTMNDIRTAAMAIDPNVVIYGEGWAAEGPAIPETEQASKANTARLGGIAAFGDEMRDGLRGGWMGGDEQGAFVIGEPGNEESVKFGIVGAVKHPGIDYTKVNCSKAPWADNPAQMIAYVSCHDDMCLADRLKCSYTAKLRKANKNLQHSLITPDLVKLQKLAETAVLTSEGVPFIWCGDEIMRDRKGVHNCFSSPDSINEIPWTNKTQYKEVFDYVRNLIQMRKAHPAFHMGCGDLVRQNLDFLPVKGGNVIAWHLNGKAVGDSWNDIIVILNSNPRAVNVDIPQGTYTVVCSDGKVDLGGISTLKGKKAHVAPQSALILYK